MLEEGRRGVKLYPFSGLSTSAVLLASRAIDPALHVAQRIQAAEELALLVIGTYEEMVDTDRKQIERNIELRLSCLNRH